MKHRAAGIAFFFMCLGFPLSVRAQDAITADFSGYAPDLVAAGLVVPDAAAVQGVPTPAPPPPTPRHTGFKAMFKGLGRDVRALPSKENLLWATAGGGLALSAHPFDDDVQQFMVEHEAAGRVFKPGRILGASGTLFATAGIIYATGRLRDKPKVSHVGTDLIQSLIISEGLTQAIKWSVRRERPDHSSHNSFPSGHAADTFAFATALERHLSWRYVVPAYLFSSYVAISRLPANRHWLSDAVFGASVGIIAGRTVTSNEASPFPVSVVPVSRGVMVLYVPRHKGEHSEEVR